MSKQEHREHDRDSERGDLDEVAEQGPVRPPAGTSQAGGSEPKGDSYEERDDVEQGRA